MICLLLVGFLIGNMFCTLLPRIRGILPWDGAIIVFLIVFIELVSYARYDKREHPPFFLTPVLFIAPFSASFRVASKQSVASRSDAHARSDASKIKWSRASRSNATLFWRFVNQFKIGMVVGFFVDAFKVGS